MKKTLASLFCVLAIMLAAFFVFHIARDNQNTAVQTRTTFIAKAQPSPTATFSVPNAQQAFRANLSPATFHFSDWKPERLDTENRFTDNNFKPRLTYPLNPLDRPPAPSARDNPTGRFNEIVIVNRNIRKRE